MENVIFVFDELSVFMVTIREATNTSPCFCVILKEGLLKLFASQYRLTPSQFIVLHIRIRWYAYCGFASVPSSFAQWLDAQVCEHSS
jgi:hypothetical protein